MKISRSKLTDSIRTRLIEVVRGPSNDTVVRLESALSSAGYTLMYAYLKDGYPYIAIRQDRSARYLPEILYDDYDKSFKIQTTSYGSLTPDDWKVYYETLSKVNAILEDLKSIDISTLPTVE